ncbi:MAG TPA: NUDIX domain-containing protein [Verrucomicrobiae bacterium]|nr:NUDIX domain-containing protein [Verrucomicrobiae bacterium]
MEKVKKIQNKVLPNKRKEKEGRPERDEGGNGGKMKRYKEGNETVRIRHTLHTRCNKKVKIIMRDSPKPSIIKKSNSNKETDAPSDFRKIIRKHVSSYLSLGQKKPTRFDYKKNKSLYKTIEPHKKQFNAAHIVLIQKNKLIMFRDSYKNEYTLAGGKKEKKEEISETAVRELYEESCKTIRLTSEFLDECQYIDYKNSNGKFDRLYIVYIQDVSKEDFTNSYVKLCRKDAPPQYLEKNKLAFFSLNKVKLEYLLEHRITSKRKMWNGFSTKLLEVALRKHLF